jgi:transaldolase
LGGFTGEELLSMSHDSNRVRRLLAEGQSVWLDFISRELIGSGRLGRLIDEDGLRGLTSNPSIFEKALSSGHEYDDEIVALARQELDADHIFDRLAIADVNAACREFSRVYTETGGADGFVSIEVSPRLAKETAETLTEAHRLAAAVACPNVMVKIPATKEGIPAIRRALTDGLNINITLIFSLADYEAVAEAYLQALEGRVASDKPIDGIHSVASFFISRIDRLVDTWLETKARESGPRAEQILGLRGKLGVANSRLAYERFVEILGSNRWKALEEKGATVQRLLWASTSTKNPSYDDLLYVNNLIGRHTVNTLPESTYEAFKDHGTIARTVDKDVAGAHAHMKALVAAGINADAATAKLQVDGVDLFVKSFDKVVGIVEQRRAALVAP